ncbi:hypothetical protein TNCV_4368801 [Trichonephila clavipes]|nr:hypothetical protein TNCV_4368801 [Trichonephila clavipes]
MIGLGPKGSSFPYLTALSRKTRLHLSRDEIDFFSNSYDRQVTKNEETNMITKSCEMKSDATYLYRHYFAKFP